MRQGRPRRSKTVVLSSDDQDDSSPSVHLSPEATKQEPDPERASRSKSKSSASTSTKLGVAKSPSKPRQNRQSSNPRTETQPKRANKSIFSFFNSATQRQQASSQDSASLPLSAPSEEDIEDDISADHDPPQLAQASRKRKLTKDSITGPDADGLPAASQKFRKVSDGSKISAKTLPTAADTRPWTERFAPIHLSELAVHKRKITDVRSILDSALSERQRPRLIVLKGSAGVGKTTAVNLLAREMGIEIMEWKSPVGTDASSGTFTSYSTQFEDFVFRSGKFAGLDLVRSDGSVQLNQGTKSSNGRQIMLVEEFPNTFAKSSPALQIFRNTILQYLAASSSSSPSPMVMVISEALLSTTTASADSFTAHRLLGPAILNHPQTAQIEFNNIAPTFMIKALDAIVVKESRKSGRRFAPGPGVLKHLAETGDIRSAVSSLEFLCLAGDDSGSWSAKVAFTKSKGRAEVSMTEKEQEALKLISNRESSLDIFHAVGRVVYNKRIHPSIPVPQPPTHFPQHRKPKVPEHDPNNLIEEVGTDTSTFIGALQENYALSCSSSSGEDAMDSLNGCIDALSDFDMLSCDRFGFGTRTSSGSAQDNLRQDDLSFQTAIRGVLFWLPSPVNRLAGLPHTAKRGDEFKMFFPSSSKLWKEKEEFEGTLERVMSTMNTLALGSSKDSTSSEKEGVAAWCRLRNSNVSKDGRDLSTEANPSLQSIPMGPTARTEMLLERLPYASRILSYRKDIPASFTIDLNTLTRISTLSSSPVSLDDRSLEEVDGGDEFDTPQDEWADRPDPEAAISKTARVKMKQKPKGEVEGGGLQIPVEHALEKFVLSDDDIEDD